MVILLLQCYFHMNPKRSCVEKEKPVSPIDGTPGMTYKPLYKMTEVCAVLRVTKPTIYDWVKHGKLQPYKIRSRVNMRAALRNRLAGEGFRPEHAALI